jgi:hypothetical protein
MFLAMEPEVEYGVSSLHRRFLEIQGQRPVFKGTVNLQQKYVTYSFEPVGWSPARLRAGRFFGTSRTIATRLQPRRTPRRTTEL